jgi:hypothetical protein
MRILLVLTFVGFLTAVSSAQKVKFSGTLFDYNGAVIVKGTVAARSDQTKSATVSTSDDDGRFQMDLEPGLYSLEVEGTGFLAIKYPEYLVVNSPTGMKMDFVMFGSRYHEPCGYSGTDCSPAGMLIKEFSVKYSPNLKQIVEDFRDLNKKEKDK